ncbi:MAG: hypothetical protein ACR2PA_14810 [Hyphomicrobiaceae bacterium]
MTDAAQDGCASARAFNAQHFAPGDVVELETSAGLAYLQVTHLHHAYPEIVRALAGLHQTRPADLNLLVNLPTRFITMTPLAANLAAGQLTGTRIGHFQIPDAARDFPVFRTPIRDRVRRIVYWWHWDGDTLRHVVPDGKIDEDGNANQRLPMREVTDAHWLLQRLTE